MGGTGQLDLLSNELSDLAYLTFSESQFYFRFAMQHDQGTKNSPNTSFTSVPKPNDFNGISSLPNFPYARVCEVLQLL